MVSFINAAVLDLGGSLDWAENQKEEDDQERIQQLCNTVGTDTAAMDAFAKELHSAITSHGEYHPRSSGMNRQTLAKLLTLKRCQTFECLLLCVRTPRTKRTRRAHMSREPKCVL